MSRIIQPFGVPILRLTLTIDARGGAQMEGFHLMPDGKQVPMNPIECASVMSQSVSGILANALSKSGSVDRTKLGGIADGQKSNNDTN